MVELNEFLSNEIFGILTFRQLIIIIHLFGLVLGAGAAFFSDFLFTHSMKDRKISKDEFKILQLNSRVIWIGLTLLFVSGLIIYLSDIDRYLNSTKFLSKMSIVLIIALNGVVFHIKHIPLLGRFADKDITKSPAFKKSSKGLFVSGAISGVSWAAAIVLGSLSSVPLGYWTIMAIYLGVIFVAGLAGLYLHSYFTRAKN